MRQRFFAGLMLMRAGTTVRVWLSRVLPSGS